MDGQRQVFGHFAVLVNDITADSFQDLTKLSQLGIPV